MKSKFGIQLPTAAQARFLPVIQSGRDLLLRDRTGTGKSFGIAVALASAATSSESSVRSLYVAPNLELATQVHSWVNSLHHGNPLDIQLLPSSSSEISQHIPHTIIGTPGRLLEASSKLPFSSLERIVLDEADQALRLPKRYAPLQDRKFRERHPKPAQQLIESIFKQNNPQMIVASATLNRPLRHFLREKKWVTDPEFVDITEGVVNASESQNVQHYCLVLNEQEIRNMHSTFMQGPAKADFDDTDERMLGSIAILQEEERVHNGILFVNNHTVSIPKVIQQLKEFNVEARDIQEYQPTMTAAATSPTPTPLWVATEFSARGMDIPDVSHVFILGRPASPASYLHMAGRTGRLSAGGFKPGKVFTLIRDQGRSTAAMQNMYKLIDVNIEKYEPVQ